MPPPPRARVQAAARLAPNLRVYGAVVSNPEGTAILLRDNSRVAMTETSTVAAPDRDGGRDWKPPRWRSGKFPPEPGGEGSMLVVAPPGQGYRAGQARWPSQRSRVVPRGDPSSLPRGFFMPERCERNQK